MILEKPSASSIHAEAVAFVSGQQKQLLIDNEWRDAKSGAFFNVTDPYNGEVLCKVARGDIADVNDAVKAARSALKSDEWANSTPRQRERLLQAVADLIEQNIEMLATLESLDQGKPFGVARYAEIPGAIEQFRYFAGATQNLHGAVIPTSINYQPTGKKVFAYTQKEPVGVVAAIVPWNSPLVLTAMKLAPALAAGCTVVLKPAEDTPLTALRLGELFVEAGFPPGVLNIVTGIGAEAGAALASHADVDKVTFTGSTATGRRILEAAKGNLKKVSLELGGKSPTIVFDDADLKAAISGAANAIFFNGGQVCVAGSRLYVQRSIFEPVVEGIAKIARDMQLGHGLNAQTQMGPLVSQAHARKVVEHVTEAKRGGAHVLTGGELAGPNESFVLPTVVANTSRDATILREEVFGPVLVCAPFDDAEDVLTLANDSDYGLAASVWTESLSRAHQMSDHIRSGTVWINCHAMYDASLPIGGMKQSGWGRDSGLAALEAYLELKTVCSVV